MNISQIISALDEDSEVDEDHLNLVDLGITAEDVQDTPLTIDIVGNLNDPQRVTPLTSSIRADLLTNEDVDEVREISHFDLQNGMESGKSQSHPHSEQDDPQSITPVSFPISADLEYNEDVDGLRETSHLEIQNGMDKADSQSHLQSKQHKFQGKAKKKSGRSKDLIWAKFTSTGNEKQQQCLQCGWTVEFPQADRLRRHFVKCNPKTNVPSNSSAVAAVRAPMTIVPVPTGSAELEYICHTSKLTRQSAIHQYFVKTTKPEAKDLDKQIVRFICGANVPFTTVENKEFLDLIKKLRPSYEVPTAKVVGGKLLNELYEEIKEKIVEKVSGKKATIMQDGWQSPQSEAVIAHSLFVQNEHYFIDADAAGENKKDSEFLHTLIKYAISWGEETFKTKIIGCVTDNCNVMKKLHRLIKKERPDLFVYGCNSHLLNLVGKSFTPDLIDEVKAVQKYFRNKDLPAAALKKLKGTRPVIPCDTRWNSQLDTFRSFLQNQAKYLEISRSDKIADMPEYIRNTVRDEELFQQIKESILVVEPIAIALDMCQKGDATVADAVHWWLQTKEAVGEKAEDSKFTKRYKQGVVTTSIVAYMLHPKYRGMNLENDHREEGRRWLENYEKGFSVLAIALQAGDSNYFSKTLLQQNIIESLQPTTWWATAALDNPDNISAAFQDLVDSLLQLPASTAGIERAFSTMSNTMTNKRNRLALEKARKISFVKNYL